MSDTIQQHNERPAAVWSSGGKHDDEASRGIADAIDYCVTRLDGERREALHRDFVAFHAAFATGLGITVPRGHLVTVGVRK